MAFTGPEHAAGMPPGTRAPSDASSRTGGEPTYRECLRNHAAAQGGHALDGCGEFMPSGAHDPLSCAACGCHRSFHRKDDGQQHPHVFVPAPATTPTTTTPRVPLLMPPPQQHHPYSTSHPQAPPFAYNPHQHQHQHQHYQHTPSGTTTESSSDEPGPGPPSTSAQGQGQARRKRFRTRFTPEQREQMLALAERVGWRMLKQDEALVDHLCAQAGVRRQVFKVWMHNNKHHRRQPQPPHSQQQQQ